MVSGANVMDFRIENVKSTTLGGTRLTRRWMVDLQKTVARFPALSRHELASTLSSTLQLDTLDKRGGDVYYICMQLGLRHFGEASLAWFKEKSRDPSATRWSLARGICERED